MSDPNDLAAFLADAWHHLAQGVAHSTAPARFVTFATTAPDGTPEVRTVALREATPSDATVQVHTDIETNKITALRQTPLAALHVWIPSAQLQIRLTAKVTIQTGPKIDAQWDKIPPTSRVSYGTMPIPGTSIDHVYAYEKPSVRARFAVLHCALTTIDLVHLDTRHRRALFKRADGWAGTWRAP